MITLVYIHGAKSSSISFNYIRSKLPGYREITIDYNSDKPFFENLKDMAYRLRDEKDLFIIAHSLGGIYALHLTKILENKILGACTLSTPFAGSEPANWLKYISFGSLKPSLKWLHEVSTKGMPIIQGHQIPISVPWINFVTKTNIGYFGFGENDGIVSRYSMEYRKKDMELKLIDSNHFEVLQRNDVVDIIKEKIDYVKQK